MPIYEYSCAKCGEEFEELVFANDTREIQCPECRGTAVTKKMSATGLTGAAACDTGGSRPFS